MDFIHSPFTAPTSEEIALADERHDMARANRWVGALAVLTALALLVAICLPVYFTYFR